MLTQLMCPRQTRAYELPTRLEFSRGLCRSEGSPRTPQPQQGAGRLLTGGQRALLRRVPQRQTDMALRGPRGAHRQLRCDARSEERRVGKESRVGGVADEHVKKMHSAYAVRHVTLYYSVLDK